MLKLEQVIHNLWIAALGLVSTGFVWIIRTVLTNKEQVKLLEAKIEHEASVRERQMLQDKERMEAMTKAIEHLTAIQSDLAPVVREQNLLLREIAKSAST